MTTNTANVADARPVRDLLRPEIEQPMGTGHSPERRRHPRYSRCLLGALRYKENNLSCACVDISEGGAQVVTPTPVEVNIGERVTVAITHHDQLHQDDFTVVQADRMANGTALHLML